MHKNNQKSLNYYAKILFAISITLFLYGLISSFFYSNKLIDPIKDVEKGNDENTVSITTIDGSEITPKDNTTKTEDNTDANTSNQEKQKQVPTPEIQPQTPTLDEQNDNFRHDIENTYGVTVHYGSETSGYTVAGLTTESITDPNLINTQLKNLNNTLSLYPKGFFQEMKNGGIPLTILLINNYSEHNVTGVTDSSYSYANISIAAIHPFQESFYHESYHYIERYLFKKGANYNSWDTLNPNYFQGWGVIDGNLSYNVTFSEDAPFVNNYAQSAAPEDRASTFEYMMADTKASCLNYGTTVWQKSKYIARTIDAVFNSASPYSVEYWERFL